MKFQEFSIKDLESFSGIKAHTIRMWEQRYGLLTPDRSDTNIRKYSDKDLKHLLNVSLLNNLGFKISKIAGLKEQEINNIIAENTKPGHDEQHLLHVLKISMLNYDEAMFNNVCEPYIIQHGLEKTFRDLFIPFMRQIGLLWLSGTICPAQEHFISSLVRQKLFVELQKLPLPVQTAGSKTFVLFLPELEIHELSLIMAAYMLKKAGFKAIFLGQSVPFEDLNEIYQRLGEVEFVSMLTTHPPSLLVNDYLKKIVRTFTDTGCRFHLTGNNLTKASSPDTDVVMIYDTAEQLMAALLS